MTDSTGKNASMIAEDTLIEMKCTACGHIADVPDQIIGELAEEDRMSYMQWSYEKNQIATV